MARDGTRSFERYNAFLEGKAKRERQARLAAMRNETAQFLANDAAKRSDLLPAFPLSSLEGGNQMQEIINSLYDVTRISRAMAVMQAESGEALPRLICRKSASIIGYATPAQWDAMRAVWPDCSLEMAEAMLAVTGPIAPQFLFSHPQALQVMAGLDPLGAAVNALDACLAAQWTGLEKVKIRQALAVTLAECQAESNEEGEGEGEGEDDTLTLAVLELAQDLMRFNALWHSERALQVHRQAIILARFDGAALIEALKDACAAVAKALIGSIPAKEGIEAQRARMISLCEKHGAAYVRRTAPLTGEADIARRIIGAFYRDFTHVFAKITDADLLVIVGNVAQFEQAAINAQYRGAKDMPVAVKRRLAEYQRHEAESDLAGMLAGISIADLESEEMGLTEAPQSGIQSLKEKLRAKKAHSQATEDEKEARNDE